MDRPVDDPAEMTTALVDQENSDRAEPRTSRFRTWFIRCAIVAVLAFVPTVVIIVARTFLSGHAGTVPHPTPSEPVLEEQTESHTCGLHTFSMLYRAYGLDPDAEKLRFRLGIDYKAVFWKPDSTGSFHPDMFMVLTQDYFDVEPVDLESNVSREKLRQHLQSRHFAPLLIERRENGHLHWVLATGADGARMRVHDSLAPAAYWEVTADFLDERVVSALMVKPADLQSERVSSIDAHAAGTAELSKALARIRSRPQRRADEG